MVSIHVAEGHLRSLECTRHSPGFQRWEPKAATPRFWRHMLQDIAGIPRIPSSFNKAEGRQDATNTVHFGLRLSILCARNSAELFAQLRDLEQRRQLTLGLADLTGAMTCSLFAAFSQITNSACFWKHPHGNFNMWSTLHDQVLEDGKCLIHAPSFHLISPDFTWFHLPIDLTDSDGFAVQCFLALVAFHQLDSTSAAATRGTCRHGSNVSWEPTTPCRLTEFGGSASQDFYNSRMCHLHSLTISIHFLLILKHCKTLFQNCSLGRPRFRILDAFFCRLRMSWSKEELMWWCWCFGWSTDWKGTLPSLLP